MEFLLMATLLHLGPESLPAFGELALLRVVGHVLPLLGLIHLLVLELHVAAELAREAEPLVKTARVAGDTDVPFLLGPNHHPPPVDGGLVSGEVILLGEAGPAVATVPNLLMDTVDVAAEV